MHDPGSALPAVIDATASDSDPLVFAATERRHLEALLATHGAVLVRGLRIEGPDELERIAMVLLGALADYDDRATPRSVLAGRVLTSTDAPAHLTIPAHNEASFAAEVPARLLFWCARPAARGGRTPLTDAVRVYRRLDAAVRDPFERLGVRYLRAFGFGPGMTWQKAFGVTEREALERHCRERGIGWEWCGGDRLRTVQVRPAVARHPLSGEPVWLNHAMALHASSLPVELRRTIEREMGAAALPHATTYGDGTPIPDEVVEVLRAAYRAETATFDWREGDLLLVDNLRVAHGREPYSGERSVAVAMGQPVRWSDLAPPIPREGVAGAPPSLASTTPEPVAPEAASDERVDALLRAVTQVLDGAPATAGDVFLEIGGDSVAALQVIGVLRARHGLSLPLPAMFEPVPLRVIAGRIVTAGEPPLPCDASPVPGAE